MQVIPKAHHRWVWDVPEYDAYMNLVQQIALAQRKAFGTDWILSKIVGDEVLHAHVWVFPGPHPGAGNKMDFEGNAAKLRVALEQ